MDAVKFLKEYKRICDEYDYCKNCPVREVFGNSILSCNEWVVRNPEKAVKVVEDWIKALPAADVVEVIRCKDCKYFNLNKWGKVNDIPLIVAHEICDFWGEGCKTDKDGYCSFAERRESCLIEGDCE